MGYWYDTTKTGEEIVWGDQPADAVDELFAEIKAEHGDLLDASIGNLMEKVTKTVTPIFQADIGRKPTPAEVTYGMSFSGVQYNANF